MKDFGFPSSIEAQIRQNETTKLMVVNL